MSIDQHRKTSLDGKRSSTTGAIHYTRLIGKYVVFNPQENCDMAMKCEASKLNNIAWRHFSINLLRPVYFRV